MEAIESNSATPLLTRFPPALGAASVGLALLFLTLHASVSGGFEIDDAYITFRYARDIGRGLGPVYNAGERVEGISNLYWGFALAPFSFVGADLLVAARVLNFALAAATAWGMARLIFRLTALRGLAAIGGALTASHSGYALWCLPGLETIFYSAGLAGLVCAAGEFALEAPSRRVVIAGCLLAFALPGARPEAAMVGLGLLLAALPWLWLGGRTRPALALAASLLFGLLALLAFRWLFYGDLVPNTYYSKVNIGWAGRTWAPYLRSIARWHAWTLAMASAGAVACVTDVGRRARRGIVSPWATVGMTAFGAIAVDLLFIWRVGADWMPGWRYFVPVLPCVALLAALGGWRVASLVIPAGKKEWRGAAAGIALLGVALAQLMTLSPADLRAAATQTTAARETRGIARELAPRVPAGSTLAVAAAGVIPYFLPDVGIIDMLGLNDRHIAREGHAADPYRWEKTDENYILGRKPDFIVIPFMAHPKTGERIPIPALCWPGVYNHPDFRNNYDLAWTFDKVTVEPLWVFRRKAEATR